MKKYQLSDYHQKALNDYGLDDTWPDGVLINAKNIEDQFLDDKHRLEDFPFVTIDGEDAKDFDDAIFCSQNDDGFHLKVAIADVSHYVKPDTPIDKEASRRTTSVYFIRKVVPMLPENLSNVLCSLQPQKRRRALCVEINFDKQGIIKDYKFDRGIIKSAARLTYNQVEGYMNISSVPDDSFKESLQASFILFNQLLKQRTQRGALDFKIAEPTIKIDKDENVIDVIDRSRLTSHKLIEEFMLAANIVAADFLEKNCKKGIFRVHGNPESIKIDRLSQTLKRRSINWQGDIEDIQNLPFFLEKIQNRKDASILNTLILQAMQRAEYTTENIGHFGLKYKKYTHFTSPIRRYPDLLVHRLIIATLSNEAVEDQELQSLLEYCSAQEKSAEFASRQVIQNLLCEYAANFKGKSFKGFITGVKDFGLFIDIPKLFTSGLLHVNDLPNDYYRYNARNYSLEGKRRGNKFSLGDEINIYIGDVRELEGKISLYY
jgi:ribonuclease R